MLPNIFDNKFLKNKIHYEHPVVVELQNLLNQTLQERLSLFSRNFSFKVLHELTHCRVADNFIEIDPEILPFKHHSFDLIFSAGPLMLTNDIPGVLKQWYAALKPGGVFMAAFIGEDSLAELKNCFLSVEEAYRLPHHLRFFPTVATKDAGMLMQRAGFHLPTADRTRHVFKVSTLFELLKAIKAMGGNLLHNKSKSQLTKEFLKAVEVEYFKRYPHSDKLIVTVDIICMSGWAIEYYGDERIQQNTRKSMGYL